MLCHCQPGTEPTSGTTSALLLLPRAANTNDTLHLTMPALSGDEQRRVDLSKVPAAAP